MHVKMKKEGIIIILVFLLVLPIVNAGIGMKWEIENITVLEGSETCLSYGIYNPWPEESKVKIELSDSLEDLVYSSYSQERVIPQYTPSNSSVPVTICFKIPKLYQENCLFMGLLCEQSCQIEEKIYSGEILIAESISKNKEKKDFSQTSIAVSAPLNLNVKCQEHQRKFSSLYLLIAFVSFLLLAPKYLKRKNSYNR